MRARFCALIEEADADDAVRGVIVTAVDPVFSAGVDFKEVAAGSGGIAVGPWAEPGRGAPGRDHAGRLRGQRRLRHRRARARAELHVHRGVGAGPLRRHPCPPRRGRGVGPHRAAAAVRSACARRPSCRSPATSSTPHEALRIGLVNHVVPHDDLLPFTRALVDDIAPDRRGGARARPLPSRRRPPARPRVAARGRARRDPAGRSGCVRRGRCGRGPAEVVSDDSTRARVVDAAIACILDEGFYRASSNKIAKPRRGDLGCHPVPLRHPRGADARRCTSAALAELDRRSPTR